MQCDVRPMPINEIVKVFRKVAVLANSGNCDVKSDDGVTYVTVGGWTVVNGLNNKVLPRIHQLPALDWKFECKFECNVLSAGGLASTIYVNYYPPNGGRVRFDAAVSSRLTDLPVAELQECFDIYRKLVDKFGSGGKNTVSQFEDLSLYSTKGHVT